MLKNFIRWTDLSDKLDKIKTVFIHGHILVDKKSQIH